MSVDNTSSRLPAIVFLGSFLALAALDQCEENTDSSTNEVAVATQATRVKGCEVLLDSKSPLTADELEPLVRNPDCFPDLDSDGVVGDLNSGGAKVVESYDYYLDEVTGSSLTDEGKKNPATSLERTYALSGLGMLLASNCLHSNSEVKKGMDGQRVHVGELLASTERQEYLSDKLPKGKVETDNGVVLKKFDDGRITIDTSAGVWINMSDYSDGACITDENGNLKSIHAKQDDHRRLTEEEYLAPLENLIESMENFEGFSSDRELGGAQTTE